MDRQNAFRFASDGLIPPKAYGIERQVEVTAEEVIRELKKLGFSCIGNVVDWHNETVEITTESEDGKETKTVLVPRVTIIAKADLEKGALDAIAEVSQRANGALRVKMHDKHAALVSLGKHLGLFTDSVQIKATIGRGARKRVRSRSRCRFLDLGVRKHEAGFNRM